MSQKNSPQDPGSVGLAKTHTNTLPEPFQTDSGETLPEIHVAYETYGELSPSGDNAVLVIHALTGDAHAAGFHSPDDPRPGWWDPMIGPGKAIDTRKYFVVSSNNLGGCSGTTGPTSINPATGHTYNTGFPVITVEDTVRVHKLLLERLGVKRLKTVIGGSLAGMQTLEGVLRDSDFCDSVIPVAGAARLDPMGIAWDKIARRAITADGDWQNGDYDAGQGPRNGLSAARMLAHVTYLSKGIMWEKFGREIRDKDKMLDDIASRFEVESYLDHQGDKFVDRFDANSYLYISRMMDLYDASLGFESLEASLSRLKTKCMLVCFISDWLFPPERSMEITQILQKLDYEVELHTVESTYGHDAFLVQYDKLTEIVGGFLARLENGGPIGINATPIPRGCNRLVLSIPGHCADKPILWEFGKKYSFSINIMRSELDAQSGWQVCEFDGNEQEIAQAVTELRNMGIWVDPGGHDAIDHDRAEVV